MLEGALGQLYSVPIQTTGSGRTDSGTHAVAQVVHFEAPKILRNEGNLLRALNAILPPTICVKGAWLAPEDFHARASARRKTYVYKIWNARERSALWYQRALWVPRAVNLDALQAMTSSLVGERDFRSFQSRGTPTKTTVRHIYSADWIRRVGPNIEFRVTGSGFLKQMVRNLVGTMLELARHSKGPEDLARILRAHDRREAFMTAPAHGLYLYRVVYPASLDKRCTKL